MEYDDLDVERDLEIDPDQLDVECLRQPTLFYRYSRAEAEAKRRLTAAHENVKVVRSGLIRGASGIKELSNAQKVEAYYRDHPDHKEAKEEMSQAEYDANMATAAVYAFRQRKDLLENLIRLAMADYFARPSEPRDLREEYDKMQERVSAERKQQAAEKLNRKSPRSRKRNRN